jgi:D-alanyl-D-alanine carboxypeptidase
MSRMDVAASKERELMPFGVSTFGRLAAFAALAFGASAAMATPYLVVDADSGQVLVEHNATEVWYPASLTKLMTVYVALDAVRAGRLTMDTPLVVSARAASQQPSKMGFRPGPEVTLDNALKMLMVKSPNDVAVTVAEGVSGSVEAFAAEMNAAAQKLGLHESHFVNPNGLHNPEHVSSARDMAMIGRALLREFPEHASLFDIGALQLDAQIIRNHNGLLGRYPGADGMKTGFTCPAGFNVVASANHYGRHLITVVLGAPSARLRNQEAADLFDRGFAMSGGLGSLDSLPSTGVSAPNPRANVCLHRSAVAIAADQDEGGAEQEIIGHAGSRGGGSAVVAASGQPTRTMLSNEQPQFDPVPVFVGPVAGWSGPVLGPRPNPAVAALPADAKAYTGGAPDPIKAATGARGRGADAAAGRQASCKAGQARDGGHQGGRARREADDRSKQGASDQATSKSDDGSVTCRT